MVLHRASVPGGHVHGHGFELLTGFWADLGEESLQGRLALALARPDHPPAIMVDHDGHVAMALAVAELVHAAARSYATFTCTIRRRPSDSTTNTYNVRNIAVGTVRKSMAAIGWKLQGLGHSSQGCLANTMENGSTWSTRCRPVCWCVSRLDSENSQVWLTDSLGLPGEPRRLLRSLRSPSPATGTCPHHRNRRPLRQGAQFPTSASSRRLIRAQSTFASILGMGSASASSK